MTQNLQQQDDYSGLKSNVENSLGNRASILYKIKLYFYLFCMLCKYLIVESMSYRSKFVLQLIVVIQTNKLHGHSINKL